MGNSCYKRHCHVSFRLQDDSEEEAEANSHFTEAGKPIQGTITLEVKKEVPPTKLTLRFEGYERSKAIVGQSQYQHIESSCRLLAESTTVLQQDDILGILPDAPIPPGVYTFPFEIETAENLPSSMNWVRGRNESCAIDYQLKLDLKPQHMIDIKSYASIPVQIRSKPILSMSQQAVSLPVQTIPVKFFGLTRGTISMATRLEKKTVGRGTNCHLSLAVRNDAATDIQRIEVRILESLHFRVNDYSVRQSTNTVDHILDVPSPGVSKTKHMNSIEAKALAKHGGPSSEESVVLMEQLDQSENILEVHIPEKCRDTYEGELISVSHILRLTLVTSSQISNPSVDIPFEVGSPPTAESIRAEEASAFPSVAEVVAIPVFLPAVEKVPLGDTAQYGMLMSLDPLDLEDEEWA